ncbi:MAG: type II secretion system protein [Candidatus Levyibacteriota bacterium]|nr:MAG: type II secretion system protein [Candidatus Levybacteria bacterium]
MRYKLYTIRFQKGFTLVEMLIYMGLLSILLVVMVDLFAASLDVQLESTATSSVDRDGKFLYARFLYDIPRAQNIVSPTLGASSNTLQISIDGINNTYAINEGSLKLTNNNGINMLNSFDTTVSNLLFQHLGNTGGKPVIRVSYTLNSKTSRTAGTESKNFQTSIGLR